MQVEQLSFIDDERDELPEKCCYRCEHFAEFKEPRTYESNGSEFGLFGMCCKGFNKNGSFYLYNVYVPEGCCKDFKNKKYLKQYRNEQ